jgi:hypothetical protein
MRRFFPAVLALAGCGSPLPETGLDDALPPPPAVQPTLIVAAEPVAAPVVAPHAEERAPAADHALLPAPPTVPATMDRPAEIPAVRRAVEPEPQSIKAPDEIEDHYHRDFSVPGDHVIFQLAAGSSQIWLFPDRGTFDNYFGALRGGDRKTVESIRSKGVLRFIPVNTKGIVLEAEKGIRRVSVSAGPLAGTLGWIDEDHLRAEPAPTALVKAKQDRARELARQKDVKAKKDAFEMENMLRVFGPGARPMPNPQPLPSTKRKGQP